VATYWAIGYVCPRVVTLTMFLAVGHLYRLVTNGPLNSSHTTVRGGRAVDPFAGRSVTRPSALEGSVHLLIPQSSELTWTRARPPQDLAMVAGDT
jgi:hypothetical protein